MKLGEELGVARTPTVMITRGGGMARGVEHTIEAIRDAVQLTESGG